MEDKNLAEFEKEWLKMEKYDFKILTLIAVLADEKLAYRGTLNDMCEFLGVTRHTANKNKIKEAVQNLVDSKYVMYMLDPRDKKTYTITLLSSAEKKREVIKIQKKWIEMVRGSKFGQASWENILRVWLYLIDNKKEIITNADIATDLQLNLKTVSRIKQILVNDLKAIKCVNRAKKIDEKTFVKLGQTIDTFAWIN